MSRARSVLGGWVSRLGGGLGRRLDGGGERLVKRRWLRKRLARTIDAVALQMFPAGGAIPYSSQDVGLTDYMLRFLEKIPRTQSDLLCVLLVAYEYGLPLLYLQGLSYSRMSDERQFRMLEHLHDSSIYPLRMLNVVLRMFFTFGYMSDERVLREMGYFKMHAYPQDSRLVEILQELPWERVRDELMAEQEARTVASSEAQGATSPEAVVAEDAPVSRTYEV